MNNSIDLVIATDYSNTVHAVNNRTNKNQKFAIDKLLKSKFISSILNLFTNNFKEIKYNHYNF